MAYPKLREYGHLHRGQIGVLLQTITPTLAEGLGLLCNRGAIVADITSGSPADAAGLRIGDIVERIDGEPVDSILPVAMRLFTSNGSESVMLGVVRGEVRFTVEVAVEALPNDLGRLTDLIDPTASAVPDLGILGVGLTAEVAALLPSLRSPVGVVVAARAAQGGTADVTLLTGDVIHAVNGIPVTSLDALRALLGAAKSRSSIVLQIERNGQLTYLAYEAD
jgi:serine protease Do